MERKKMGNPERRATFDTLPQQEKKRLSDEYILNFLKNLAAFEQVVGGEMEKFMEKSELEFYKSLAVANTLWSLRDRYEQYGVSLDSESNGRPALILLEIYALRNMMVHDFFDYDRCQRGMSFNVRREFGEFIKKMGEGSDTQQKVECINELSKAFLRSMELSKPGIFEAIKEDIEMEKKRFRRSPDLNKEKKFLADFVSLLGDEKRKLWEVRENLRRLRSTDITEKDAGTNEALKKLREEHLKLKMEKQSLDQKLLTVKSGEDKNYAKTISMEEIEKQQRECKEKQEKEKIRLTDELEGVCARLEHNKKELESAWCKFRDWQIGRLNVICHACLDLERLETMTRFRENLSDAAGTVEVTPSKRRASI